MKAVISAGGRGTRVSGVRNDIPKPMFPVCGKPVLQRTIEALRDEGVDDITVTTGYLADKIESYFKDGSGFGVRIGYYREKVPLGTAGALFECCPDEDFFYINGDLVFSFYACKMMEYHRRSGGLCTVLAHPNTHPFDSTAVFADDKGYVKKISPKEEDLPYKPCLSLSGIYILSPKLFKPEIRKSEKTDLDRDILIPAARNGQVRVYRSSEYVKDMGTPQRMEAVERDIEAGIPDLKNLRRKQKAVFLDRDGTINVYKGYITSPEDIELIPGAARAVKEINDSGRLAIVITNQASPARGECSIEDIEIINTRLQTLLAREDALLDRIYFCPHHPDKGFPGEDPKLKIDCECRKPKPGMILRAAEEFNIDLENSYMVGDSFRDVQCAVNAGCIPVYLRCGAPSTDPDNAMIFEDLADFCSEVL